MTWTELGILALVLERGIAALLGFVSGARAAYRGVSPAPTRKWSASATSTTMPDYVAVHSDDAVSLDYSSGIKRH